MSVAAGKTSDIIVAGAGFSGLSLALALSKVFNGEIEVAVFGSQPAHWTNTESPRAFALSASSKNVLDALGIWSHVASRAQPVLEIALTDSPLEAGVRPVLLTYKNTLSNGEPASYIVPAAHLASALAHAVDADDTIRCEDADVADLASSDSRMTVQLSTGDTASTSLLVAADGSRGQLRKAAGVQAVGWHHGQIGIVTTVAHERPHNGQAVQHFLPAGPFAILPLVGNRSCITWSEEEGEAKRILSLSDADFLSEVDQRFGGRLGDLQLVGPRQSFPLATYVARSYVSERFALLGDSAHRVHPIAGQGLNLALRDVAALSECLIDAARVGLDVGSATPLERYERWRRFDSTVSAATFDGLSTLFSKNMPLLRAVREIGLGVVDRLPQVKNLLVSEAAGLTGEPPKLLVGQWP